MAGVAGTGDDSAGVRFLDFLRVAATFSSSSSEVSGEEAPDSSPASVDDSPEVSEVSSTKAGLATGTCAEIVWSSALGENRGPTSRTSEEGEAATGSSEAAASLLAL